jgi:hypothetical protein
MKQTAANFGFARELDEQTMRITEANVLEETSSNSE